MQLLLNIHVLDLFDYETNPAYTLVEAPHQKKGKFSNWNCNMKLKYVQ